MITKFLPGFIANRLQSAMTSEASRHRITVAGRYFMNWPTTPGQNSSGMKTTILVRVEPTIGGAMRLAAVR